jgi:hypothetical protein
MCDDTHDCDVPTGDKWLESFIPKLIQSKEYQEGKTAIFLTYDEGEGGDGQHLPTIVISPSTKPRTVSERPFDHYSLLRTNEGMLGLPFLGKAATAASMESDFNLTPQPSNGPTAPNAAPTPAPTPEAPVQQPNQPAPAGAPAPSPYPAEGFYVSPNGNDANDGTKPETAWKTLARASAQSITPGSFLRLEKDGTYSGTLTLDESNVTVGSYGNGNTPPILTNGDPGYDSGCIVINGGSNVVRDLKLQDCSTHEGDTNTTARGGIVDKGQNNTIQDDDISGNQAAVEIEKGSQGAKVYNNNIHDNNKMTKNTPGGDDDFGAYSIAVEGGGNVDIAGNTITGAVAASDDYGQDGSGLEVYGNNGPVNFHNNVVSGNAGSIEISGGSDVTIQDNQMDRTIVIQSNGSFAGPNKNIKIVGNKISDNAVAWVADNPPGTVELQGNQDNSKGQTVIGSGAGSVTKK